MKDIEKSLVRIAAALENLARVVERAYWDEHPEADMKKGERHHDNRRK